MLIVLDLLIGLGHGILTGTLIGILGLGGVFHDACGGIGDAEAQINLEIEVLLHGVHAADKVLGILASVDIHALGQILGAGQTEGDVDILGQLDITDRVCGVAVGLALGLVDQIALAVAGNASGFHQLIAGVDVDHQIAVVSAVADGQGERQIRVIDLIAVFLGSLHGLRHRIVLLDRDLFLQHDGGALHIGGLHFLGCYSALAGVRQIAQNVEQGLDVGVVLGKVLVTGTRGHIILVSVFIFSSGTTAGITVNMDDVVIQIIERVIAVIAVLPDSSLGGGQSLTLGQGVDHRFADAVSSHQILHSVQTAHAGGGAHVAVGNDAVQRSQRFLAVLQGDGDLLADHLLDAQLIVDIRLFAISIRGNISRRNITGSCSITICNSFPQLCTVSVGDTVGSQNSELSQCMRSFRSNIIFRSFLIIKQDIFAECAVTHQNVFTLVQIALQGSQFLEGIGNIPGTVGRLSTMIA